MGPRSRFPVPTVGGAVPVALAAAVLLVLPPAPAAAYGSYGSKTETGSAIALFAVGGLLAVPTAFVLVDDPLTTQRVVGRSLVIAGGLVMIGFGAFYFISDDPVWIPHALGWGIGGGLALSGFICWLTDDDPGEAPGEASGGPAAGAGEAGAGAGEAAPSSSGVPADDGEEGPLVPLSSPPAGGGVGLAPWLAPGGFGLLLAAAW
ncbi:MAG: hypothetical protein JXB32_25365 [Deltaproteobacteria bacterium]|nr:hypothetical protein [Deltaproteobacteria bacterium]